MFIVENIRPFVQAVNNYSCIKTVEELQKKDNQRFAIGIIGCYKGFNSAKGTEGVGKSANSAVVIASLMVFIIDLLAVQVTNLLGLT